MIGQISQVCGCRELVIWDSIKHWVFAENEGKEKDKNRREKMAGLERVEERKHTRAG
jgi:hypothetical protein